MAESFNPFDPEFTRNPYPTYARMRDEAAVARVRIGVTRMFRMLAVRHDFSSQPSNAVPTPVRCTLGATARRNR